MHLNTATYISGLIFSFCSCSMALNLTNNSTPACLYEGCFRSLTGGKVIKYVRHYLLFLALFKMLEQCKVPVGVSEEGTQNTAASVHREPLP